MKKHSFHSISNISFVLIGLLLAVQLWNYSELWRGSDPIAEIEAAEIVNHSDELLYEIESILSKLHPCLMYELCESKPIDLSLLSQKLNTFTQQASRNKSLVSLVGANEYPKLEIAIKRYQARPTPQLFYTSLFRDYMKIKDTYNDLVSIQAKQEIARAHSQLHISLILFLLVTLLFIAFSRFYQRRYKTFNQTYDINNDRFNFLANQINTLNSTNLIEKVSNLSLPQTERTVYSHLLELHKGIEEGKQNFDLYQQLYTLIGYEIRGITTTIDGGVRLLVQNADEDAALMAKDISSATNTLAELAENYNRLITQGVKEQGNASILNLISELIVHLKTKAQRQGIQLECYIEDNLPNTVEANPTHLFWVLFLKLSNALITTESKRVLLYISSHSSQRVEQLQLNLDLIFLAQENHATLNQLTHDEWLPLTNKTLKQDNWSKKILGFVNRFDSMWLSQGELEKQHFEIDLTPIDFSHSTQSLAGRNILICADTSLQLDIIKNTLSRFGANITLAYTPNAVFQQLIKKDNLDAIIISDQIKGIKLGPFCKTLKSRLKKKDNCKLLLTVSESTSIQSAHEYVDRIFTMPLLPHEFIPNLVDTLKNDADAKDTDSHQLLIVEDDKVQQYMLQILLKMLNYQANIVSSGEEAIEYCKNNSVDIIFMDCIMPGMGGLEATKSIRDSETNSHITIIGATALTSTQEHRACIDAGMDYVISKPYKKEQIAKIIKKYLAIQKIS